MTASLGISILVVNAMMMAVVGMGLELRHFAELSRPRRMAPSALIAFCPGA